MEKEGLEKEIMAKIEGVRKLGKKVRRPRDWVKLHCDGVLHGSLNARMTPDQFCIFLKMIVMGEKMGPVPGLISDNDFRPLPYPYLAHLACCGPELFESTLAIAKEECSIYENSHGIYIINFDKYQFTEYDRQKPYRVAKKEKERRYKTCPECHYAVEDCQRTARIEVCVRCRRKGQEVLLVKDGEAG